MTRYEKTALSIVPVGSRGPSLVLLRRQIAAALETEARAVEATAYADKEEAARALAAAIVKKAEAQARAAEAAATKARAEAAVARQLMHAFLAVQEALETYLEWIDGHGHPEEQRAKWNQLVEAYRHYRSLRR